MGTESLLPLLSRCTVQGNMSAVGFLKTHLRLCLEDGGWKEAQRQGPLLGVGQPLSAFVLGCGGSSRRDLRTLSLEAPVAPGSPFQVNAGLCP